MKITISREACISCGACVVICPCSAIRFVNGRAAIDQDLCIQCQRCICKCYTRAICAEEEA